MYAGTTHSTVHGTSDNHTTESKQRFQDASAGTRACGSIARGAWQQCMRPGGARGLTQRPRVARLNSRMEFAWSGARQ